VLLLLTTALCAYHGLASWRGGSRPTELRAGPAPVADQAATRAEGRRSASPARPVAAPLDFGRVRKSEPPGRSVGPGKAANLTGPIDVNRATLAELQTLPGIGPKLAERIRDTRAQQPFRSVDDLRRVPGIGVKTLERLRPYVTVDGSAPKVVATNEDGAR
jgi:competence protein ComEA